MNTDTNKSKQMGLLALAVALSQLGVCEDPKGSNRGKQVEAYLAAVGLKGGYAWCQAFVFWCFMQVAIELHIPCPVPKTGGVKACWNKVPVINRITKADALHNPALIKPGMQFFLLFSNGSGHTGIVERVDHMIMHTIEGNTNDEGSREGFEVCRRQRRMDAPELLGFAAY